MGTEWASHVSECADQLLLEFLVHDQGDQKLDAQLANILISDVRGVSEHIVHDGARACIGQLVEDEFIHVAAIMAQIVLVLCDENAGYNHQKRGIALAEVIQKLDHHLVLGLNFLLKVNFVFHVLEDLA